jgi:hypothetical protein
MNDALQRGTTAHTPDLDWSQVRETILMLELAAGQVDAAMRDSNSSVSVLTETFTSIVDTLQGIEAHLGSLADETQKAEILSHTQQATMKVHQAVIAFQFYDKLAQRLDHVCQSLSGLSAIVSDQKRLYSPSEWTALQAQISAKYTMIEERQMFDAVMAGKSVKDALDDYMELRMKEVEQSGGDIELF